MSGKVILRLIYLPVNQGHGNARRISLEHCRNELVAIMDADDISYNNRFEEQLKLLAAKPMVSIVGGQITEFVGEPSNITGVRFVPEDDVDIKRYMKKRCPMNQMSVMFKKKAVEDVGGYLDWFCEEDYYLWIRLALKGYEFANVPCNLVNVRTGYGMSARRGGWKYFESEAKLQKYMFNRKMINFLQYLYNVALRFLGEVMTPTFIRVRLFYFMRKRYIPQKQSSKKEKMDSIIKQNYPPFSVAMCVYGKDNAEWFDKAMQSIINQTVQPNEIVLVVDGPISEKIQKIIDKYMKICEI